MGSPYNYIEPITGKPVRNNVTQQYILISGLKRSGKDFTATILKQQLEEANHTVEISSLQNQ